MEIEQEASLMGWVPEDQFKGDKAKWVDAETFVDKGKHIMPILQKNNERLLNEVATLKGTVTNLTQSVAQATESMEALKTFHEESTKTQVAKARADLLNDLKTAKTDGDVDREVELTGVLSEFDAAQKAVEKKQVQQVAAPAAPKIAPEVSKWFESNQWYNTDPERSGFFDGIARKMRADGNTVTGPEFLDQAKAILEERLGLSEGTPGNSKVEGGGSGSSPSGSRGGVGYAALPKEARDQCDKQAEKFVGANRAYKTMKEWQTFFASEYNKGN